MSVERTPVQLLHEIADDIKSDVARWERQEFNGRNVATMYGELAACVHAIAMVLAADIASRQAPT